MAFWACSFMFDGIPCENFELMLYDIDSHTQSDGRIGGTVSVVEDKVPGKWKPYFYGTEHEEKLSFTMVFGVNETRANEHRFLDRYELEAVALWLTGHNEYKWLEISQDDMINVRYRCIVKSLEIVEFNMIPWALSMTVECDSPYAYKYPQIFEYAVAGTRDINFYNESSHNGFYMPKIEIELSSGGSFEICNHTDNDRKFSFASLSPSVKEIFVDNEHGIIMSGDSGLNIYPNFNFNFFRLCRGENKLTANGNGVLRIVCEFPVNVGG